MPIVLYDKATIRSAHECRLSAKRPPTLRPSQQTWAVSLPVGCHHLHPQSPFIIITQPKDRNLFNRPTEGRRLSQRPIGFWLQLYIPRWFTRPQTGPMCGVSLCARLAGVLGHYTAATRVPRLRIGERPREVAQEGSTG